MALLIAVSFVLSMPLRAQGPTPTATLTQLTITDSTGHRVTQVIAGNPITLTASVKTVMAAQIFLGTVVFCDTAVTTCLDGHALGSRQIAIPTGTPFIPTATLTILPTFGAHTFRAVFVGTDAMTTPGTFPAYAKSTSSAYAFNVVGPLPGVTATSLTSSGSPGNYTLKANVLGTGAGYTKPTGMVNFFDATNSNASLGTANVGATTFSFGFLPPVSPTLPPNVFFFVLSAVADINNDGLPDLIFVAPDLTNFYQYDIFTMLNQGHGNFGFLTQSATIPGTANPLAMVTGDFNNDDKIDLAISTDDALVYVFGGSGFGPFAPPTTIQTYFVVTSMAVADLAHTGQQSIFEITPIGPGLLKNLGSSGFTFNFAPQGLQTPNSWDWPSYIATGDVNGDGFTDFVVANSNLNNVTVYFGNGQGGFAQTQSFDVGASPSAIEMADFNGDGILDLAVANSGDNTVSLLLGNTTNNIANGAFTLKSTTKLGSDPIYLTTADFNGDGIIDLASANFGDGSVTVLQGKGDGTFNKKYILNTLTGDSSVGLLAGDFNADGFPDIVAAGEANLNLFTGQLTASTNATLTGVGVAGTGTHNVEANYPGDTNYQGSTSNQVALTAAPLTTALQLVALPSPSTWGQQVTLTATLSPYAAQGHTTDTELVTFYNGTVNLGTGTLTLGVASINVSTLSVATHHLRAVYGGDTNFASSTSSTVLFSVGQTTSSTVLTAATSNAKVGVADVLTATVTGFSSARGNVVFTQDGNTLCTVVLGSNGKATCSYIPWSTTAANLVATYAGDVNHTASTSNTLTLTATYTFNSAVVLSFNSTTLTYPGATSTTTCVTRATSAAPTGTVEILDGNTNISTLTLGGDGCAYWYINPGLGAGTHHMRAFYSGDGNNPGGYSAITNVTVSQANTQMGVWCWNASFAYGQNYQCNVSAWSNSGTPPGSITYSYDGGAPQSVSLVNGNTSFLISLPAVGNHTVAVGYPGTADFAPVAAVTENFTVTP